MGLLRTAAVAGLGYVLGARAGRGRYDQLVALGQRLAARPEAQQLAQRLGMSTGSGAGQNSYPSGGSRVARLRGRRGRMGMARTDVTLQDPTSTASPASAPLQDPTISDPAVPPQQR
ncbi:MAG: hypothetical protein M3P96_08610 [Actinomycetota bacterium]|nr:hypothetical protein [Actinomycetota bacterium]